MGTLVCYRFKDGYRAYFVKGDAEHHLVTRSDKIIEILGLHHKIVSKELKINYSTWLKRLKR
jgi:hypothetical protein